MEDIFKFKRPGIAVDVILFTIKDDDLNVGLIKRDDEPYYGKHALPGRFVRYDEPIEETAKIALKNKGGITPESVFLEQLYTFGQNLVRDTRIRTISIVYYGLVASSTIDFQNENKFLWYSVYKLPPLGFDHKEIIDYAVKRLRKKIINSNFAHQLMPGEFTITELQQAYEVILHEKMDKRNFRKKLKEINILKRLPKKRTGQAFRPAMLYAFRKN